MYTGWDHELGRLLCWYVGIQNKTMVHFVRSLVVRVCKYVFIFYLNIISEGCCRP